MALTETERTRLREKAIRLVVLRKRFAAVKGRMGIHTIEQESRLWRKFVRANEGTK